VQLLAWKRELNLAWADAIRKDGLPPMGPTCFQAAVLDIERVLLAAWGAPRELERA
jgi:hypothetical protein